MSTPSMTAVLSAEPAPCDVTLITDVRHWYYRVPQSLTM